MTDTGIAQDYLTMLLERLDAGRLDPAQVDWPFALEAWRAVCEEIERLRGELEQLRGEIEQPQPVPQWLTDQHNVHLRPCPFCEATEVQLVSLGSASSALDMSYFVQCEKCSARGPVTLLSRNAVSNWNYAREARDAALEAVRAWELASELELKPGSGEGG